MKIIFYSLLYHYITQKKSISKVNLEKVLELGKIIDNNIKIDEITDKEYLRSNLENFLVEKNFSYVTPLDYSVYFDNSFVIQSKKVEIQKNSEIKYKQTPKAIRLIQNSIFILKSEGIKSLFQALKVKLKNNLKNNLLVMVLNNKYTR